MKNKLGIAVFTIVEVVTLVIWLALVKSDVGVYQVSMTSFIAGVVTLAVGIIIEHLLAYNVVNDRRLLDFRGVPVGKKAVVSIIETVIWALWLALTSMNLAAASVVLAILLVVEHSLSDNVFRNKGLFSNLVDGRTVGFSIIEAAGAAAWLNLVQSNLPVAGVSILFIASFIEHTMAVELGQRSQ